MIADAMATKAKLAPAPASAPNLFELAGTGLTVSYATSSFAGPPQMTVKKGTKTKTFAGEQIRTAPTEIGILVNVDWEAVPDLRNVTLTVVIPRVNLGPTNKAKITTIAITTTAKTSIGGPGLVTGQVQSYKVDAVAGTASRVFF
jgi:hypothetical protein